MHRLPLLIAAAQIAAALAVAAPAAAQDAPPRAHEALSLVPDLAPALSPKAVVQRFVAGVDARDVEARPCAFLSRRLRALIDSPVYLGRDPRFPDSYRARDEVRACDVAVALIGGFDEDGWRGTRLVRTAFVARHGNRVQLRATVVRRFRERPQARRAVADVFLLREDGAWRIVSPSLLWEIGLDDGDPRTFAELRRHLRWLAGLDARARGYERRLIRGYLTTRTPIAAEPLPFAGRGSEAGDALGDVHHSNEERGAVVRPAPTVDLRGAALRSDAGTLTFELRFRGAVPADATLDLHASQGRQVPGTARERAFAATTWTVSLHDGWASARLGDLDQPQPLRGLRASADGETLRLSLPASALRGQVRFARPFRWSLSAFAQVTGSDRLGDVWTDGLPERQELDSRIGVLHRP